MSETLDYQPTEREMALSAHQRHLAFRAKIRAQAAALLAPVAMPIVESPEMEAIEVDPVIADTIGFIDVPIRIEGAVRKIQNLVCEKLRLPLAVLLSSRRNRKIVMARQIGIFLCMEHTSASMPDIGRRFGGRDHTTVIHAYRRVRAMVNSPIGTGISVQWQAKDCDVVRSRVAELRAAMGPHR